MHANLWLPRAVVRAPSLTELKEHLENALRHRVEFRACPVQGQDLDWTIFSSSGYFTVL